MRFESDKRWGSLERGSRAGKIWGTIGNFFSQLDTTTSVSMAVIIGIITATGIYLYPPWKDNTPGPPALDVTATEKRLAADPIDHATRLELARYYLQWGLAISRGKMPMDEMVTDSELASYFGSRLSEWEKLGQDVSRMRTMLRDDFPSFRNLFVKEERTMSKGMFERAVILFRQTRALGATLSPRDLYDLGTAYYQMGPEGYAGAAKYLGEAVAKGLVSARALTFLGNVAVARGDYAQGTTLYRRALEYAPEDPILAFNLALAYKEVGQYDPAIEYLRQTLKIYQDRENLVEDELTIILQARLALGWCLLKKTRYSEAAQQLESLLQAQPDLAEGHYWLGVAYQGMGHTELARVHWTRASKLQPGFRDVNERLLSLESPPPGPAPRVASHARRGVVAR